MKTLLFTVVAIGLSAACNAQQKSPVVTIVKFTPPVIAKDTVPAKSNTREVVKFTPPVIVKDKPAKRKPQTTEKVKFIPPVIVKDSVEKL